MLFRSYVSLALTLGPPPKFEMLYSPANLPQDVVELLDTKDESGRQAELPMLLSAFYEQADVSSLWVKYLPAMTQDAEKYQLLLTKLIQETSGYLGIESGTYLGRRFSLMLNPLAAPGRKVIAVSGDGAAMYSLPALWTMAREKLDVVTIICANRSYNILNIELGRVGALQPGPKTLAMLDLHHPVLDFVKMAEGMGVEASRASTNAEFAAQFADAMARRGPRVIEAVLPGGVG